VASKQNIVNGIPNGNTVTAANSGGTSGDAWNSTSSTSATLISDNTHTAHGTQAVKIATTTAQVSSMTWTLTASGTWWFRIYFWIDSIVAATNPSLCRLRGTTDTVQAMRVTFDDTRHIQLRNTSNSLISTMTAAFTFSQWNRVEGFCTPGSGTTSGAGEAKLFVGDNSTPVTNGTLSTTGQNMGSVTNIDAINFGQVVALASLPAEWMDDFAVSNVNYPGAYVQTLSPASIASAESFGTPTETPGRVTITLTSITSAEAFGTPASQPGSVTRSPASIATAEAFGTPFDLPGAVILNPASIPTAEAFGTAVSQPGSVTRLPASIPTAEAFGTPSETPGRVTISPSSIPSAETFGTPTDAPGSVTRSPASIATAEAFGTPSSLASITLFPASIPSAETFGVPTASTPASTITLHPPSIDSEEAFGQVIAARLSPGRGACCTGEQFRQPCCTDGHPVEEEEA
jgi:hypothetical protein